METGTIMCKKEKETSLLRSLQETEAWFLHEMYGIFGLDELPPTLPIDVDLLRGTGDDNTLYGDVGEVMYVGTRNLLGDPDPQNFRSRVVCMRDLSRYLHLHGIRQNFPEMNRRNFKDHIGEREADLIRELGVQVFLERRECLTKYFGLDTYRTSEEKQFVEIAKNLSERREEVLRRTAPLGSKESIRANLPKRIMYDLDDVRPHI